MIYFSIGLHGRFAEWCDGVIAKLVGYSLGSVTVTDPSSSDEFLTTMIKSGGSHFLVVSRQPRNWIRHALAGLTGRCVVALDDPRNAVAELMVRYGFDLLDATRAVASSCGSILGYTAMAGTLVLHADRHELNAAATAVLIGRYLGLSVDEHNISEIIGELADARTKPGAEEKAAWWRDTIEQGLVVVTGALAAYVAHFANGTMDKITWARDLFSTGEGERMSGAIDVSGGPRFLVIGPYIVLPAASWMAEVIVGFSDDVGEISLVVDAFAGTQLCATRVQSKSHGVVRITLDFSTNSVDDIPLEIRILNDRAVNGGRLALGPVTLTLQAGIAHQVLQDLNRVLSTSENLDRSRCAVFSPD